MQSQIYEERDLRQAIFTPSEIFAKQYYAKRDLRKASEITQSEIYAERDYAKRYLCKARFTQSQIYAKCN